MQPQIRSALGQLQDNPDYEEAWATLSDALSDSADDAQTDTLKLLGRARAEHAERHEWDAVVRLLGLEAQLARGNKANQVGFLAEKARVLQHELVDEDAALRTYRQILDVDPEDEIAQAAIAESEEKRDRWKRLLDSYLSEAASAPDDVYKASMLMRSAEMELRFGGEERDESRVIERLKEAVELDPANTLSARMLERIYRRQGDFESAASLLDIMEQHAATPRETLAVSVRRARLFRYLVQDADRARAAYEHVLELNPRLPEGISFLAEVYSSSGEINRLVALYERAAEGLDFTKPESLGDMLQLAMLHYKTRGSLEEADPWFERIRKVDPANPSMLSFFREYCGLTKDNEHLLGILTSAQRALPEGDQRRALTLEIAQLAEGREDPQKAIEQYKTLIRQDPENAEARERLKQLYRRTGSHNALLELLRQQLERLPTGAREQRLETLAEVAAVYRDSLRSETGLVGALNQMLQIDENNADVLRELIDLYERLNRWRDLLAHQQRLAKVTSDPIEKKSLLRAVGRRWLEQFSNAQNATSAYEELLGMDPADQEARDRLRELYQKRRSWAALFSLYEQELDLLEPPQRLQTLQEMAHLAAERLGRADDAIRLLSQILDEDPNNPQILDALERQAERSKDYVTLGRVLERRVELAEEPRERLATLQKLGGVYSDYLEDFEAAAKAWRTVLEIQPGHNRALRVLRDGYLKANDYEQLERLYESQGDLDGLAEVLSNAADRASEDKAKIELSYRAAAVYEDKLGQPDRAFRSYERILATDPEDVRAAQALVPLYTKDDKYARLLPLYELLLRHEKFAEAKLDWLSKLVEISGSKLNDKAAAVGYAKQSYELAPRDPATLPQLEAASRAAGEWDTFLEALRARISGLVAPSSAPSSQGKRKRRRGKASTPPPPAVGAPVAPEDAQEARLLSLKLASILADELGRTDEGVALLKELVEKDPTDQEAGIHLEGILRREDRREDLRWLIDLQVSNSPDNESRAQLLAQWATLEEEVFGDAPRAIELYRQIAEFDPGHLAVAENLPRLLIAAGDWRAAAEALEALREHATNEPLADLEAQLAEIYLLQLDEPEQALNAALRGLELQPATTRFIRVLEALAESSSDSSVKRKAAETLAPFYESHGDVRQLSSTLAVQLKTATDPVLKQGLIVRLADVQENQLQSPAAAFDTVLAAVREFPAVLDFWDRAEHLTGLTGRVADLSEAYRETFLHELDPELEVQLAERAARLHEQFGDPIGAVPYLERILKSDPVSEDAYARLKQVLMNAEQWGRLDSLYRSTVDAVGEPARRLEILGDAALVAEEITDEPSKAIYYYERILSDDPLHAAALSALDRLYEAQGEYEKLANLLRRRFDSASFEELADYKLRYARIKLNELHDPASAVEPLRDLLTEAPHNRGARELTEALLEIGDYRLQAARILEPVYEAKAEYRDLVKVLSCQLSAVEGQSDEESLTLRRQILRRLATLFDDRLKDDGGALGVLSEYVPLDPMDDEARARLIDVAGRLGQHEKAAEVLGEAAAAVAEPAVRAEILMDSAELYFKVLQDLDKAAEIYREVASLAPDDPGLVLPAARALEKILVEQSKHRELVDVLKTQIALETDMSVRRELLGRLGELSESVLEMPAIAIEAWRTRVDEDPTDDLALAALDRLYTTTEQHAELVEVLEHRRDRAEAESQRREFMQRIAELLSDQLGAKEEAVGAWRAILDDFGPDPLALRALAALLKEQARWEELVDVLERDAELTTEQSEKLKLLCSMGSLFHKRLDNPARALESYRAVLSADPAHEQARKAMEKLLGVPDQVVRHETARELARLYREAGEPERLLNALDVEIATTDDTPAKLELLSEAMRVAEDATEDSMRAFGYVRKAVENAAGHTELGPWLEQLDRLSASSQRREQQIEVLQGIFEDIFDGEVQYSVAMQIANIARQDLGRRELSIEYYKRAHDLRNDAADPLVALQEIYAENEDWQALLGILERRTEVAEDDLSRKVYMIHRAELLADKLEDVPAAIDAYQVVLDTDLDRDVCDALVPLLSKAERWNDLLELYQRQADADPSRSGELRVLMSSLASRHLGDTVRAFDELEAALEQDSQNEQAISQLEKLLETTSDPQYIERAAELLEPIYRTRADYDRVINLLGRRLEVSQDPSTRVELLKQLARLQEEQKEDYGAALEVLARLLHEDLTDEWTVAELERLAAVAEDQAGLAEIYRSELSQVDTDEPATAQLAARTGELFRELGKPGKSLKFFRRALAFEPESRELFNAVDHLLQQIGEPEQRVKLYRSALDYRFDPEERVQLLLTIAGIQQSELRQSEEAVASYREVLEIDELHEAALDKLTEVYRSAERYEELAELYSRRADAALDPRTSTPYRLKYAKLLVEKLERPEEGVAQLEEIANADPSAEGVLQELEALREQGVLRERVVEILRPIYEQLDNWQALIRINGDRLQLATEPFDKVNILRETGALWESRAGEVDKARAAAGLAVELMPDDPELRSNYERLCEQTKSFDELVEKYERVLASHDDLADRGELLKVIARVHDALRDDPRSALAAYQRLWQVDDTDREVVDKMEEIATLLSDWEALVGILSAKADLVFDDQERAGLWRRVGEAYRDMLERPAKAVEAYERAVELDPGSASTIDCLIELYEKLGRPERLVELYQQRVELAGDDELRYELLVKSAKLQEHQLDDKPGAIASLTQALSSNPGDKQILTLLNRLFAEQELYSDLLDNLELQANSTDDVEEQLEARMQIAETYATKLESFEEAVEAYRRVLEQDPNHAAAQRALSDLGEGHEEVRSLVAEILVPILQQSANYEGLVRILELRLTVEDDPFTRAETLTEIARVHEQQLEQPKSALGALLRAMKERPGPGELHEEIQRLAADVAGFADYAEALEERAQSTFDAVDAAFLCSTLGRVYEEKLHRTQEAIDAYTNAVNHAGDQPELLEALDRLHTTAGNALELHDVLERRIPVSEESELPGLYERMAKIQLKDFKDGARALASLRNALELDPKLEDALSMARRLTEQDDLFDEAAQILEDAFRATGRSSDLAEVYGLRIDRAPTKGDRLDMRRGLARVLEDDNGDPAAALRVLEQGLSDDPSDPGLIDEIERLAAATDGWGPAARALGVALDESKDLLPDVARELGLKLANWHEERLDDKEGAEKALLRALDRDGQNEELLERLEGIQRSLGRQRELIETLRRRSQAVLDDALKESLVRDAVGLARELEDADTVDALLRELLEHDDSNAWALSELTAQSLKQGSVQEAFDLLMKRIEMTIELEKLRELRLQAAELAREQLDDLPKTIELYERIFEDDPTDAGASTALRDLYAKAERWTDLSGLLERLVDMAESPETRGALRMELVGLNPKTSGDKEAAIDLLRAVLDEEPSRVDAARQLTDLLEAEGRDNELADLLEQQADAAEAAQDLQTEMVYRLRLANTLEARLGEADRAISVLETIVDRDPTQRQALEDLARLQKAAENWDAAADAMRQLIGITQGEDAVRWALEAFEVYYKLERFEDAIGTLERALDVQPGHAQLIATLRGIYDQIEDFGKLAGLITHEAEHTSDVDRKVQLLREAAKIHGQKQRDLSAAAEKLEQASKLKPDDRELLLELCDVFSECGRGADAVATLQRIVDSYGGRRSKALGDIHRRLAKAQMSSGNPAEAIEELEKARRIEPGNVAVLCDLANLLLDAGDLKKAQQMLRALLLQRLDEAGPMSKAQVFYKLGLVHQQLGEKTKAIQMLERALQTDEMLDEARRLLDELKA